MYIWITASFLTFPLICMLVFTLIWGSFVYCQLQIFSLICKMAYRKKSMAGLDESE